MLVQQGLAEDPFSGAVFAFRGRRAGLIKLLWHDGIGLCLLTKRLEHGPVRLADRPRRPGCDRPVDAAAGGAARRLRMARRRCRAAGRSWPGNSGADSAGKCWPDAAASAIIAACRSTSTRLPDDPAILQQMLRDVVAAAAHQHGDAAGRERQAAAADPAPAAPAVRPPVGAARARTSCSSASRISSRRVAENRGGQDAADTQQEPPSPGTAPTQPRRPAGASAALRGADRRRADATAPAAAARCM